MGNALPSAKESFCCAPRTKDGAITDRTSNGGYIGVRSNGDVPPVLHEFLEARRVGDAAGAAACCSQDMVMRGPMGEFRGLTEVRDRAFSKPSQQLGKILLTLSYQPDLSTLTTAVYAREFEAQIGPEQVPLRQEFSVASPGTADAKVSMVEFSKIGD